MAKATLRVISPDSSSIIVRLETGQTEDLSGFVLGGDDTSFLSVVQLLYTSHAEPEGSIRVTLDPSLGETPLWKHKNVIERTYRPREEKDSHGVYGRIENKMKEIRLHGRGGQGVVMGAEMLAYAFVLEGKYASSFPTFGAERRGAPVAAFLRCDEKPIRETHQIYDPDCVMCLDPFIGRSLEIFKGLKGDGIAIINTPKQSMENWPDSLKVLGLIDATALALHEIGRAIVNTCMLGVIARVTGWVKLDSVISSLDMNFEGKLLQKNMDLVKRGYETVAIAVKG